MLKRCQASGRSETRDLGFLQRAKQEAEVWRLSIQTERMIHAAEDGLGAMMRERTKPDTQAWKVKGNWPCEIM